MADYVSGEDFNFASFNGLTVLPCASLIELLLILDSKISLKGDFSLGRGAKNGSTVDLVAGGKQITAGATLNDHSTGRGIDIGNIGPNDGEMYSTWEENIDVNRKAFTLLLDTLNSIEDSFLPDLIVFDDRLADEYGMVALMSNGANSSVRASLRLSWAMVLALSMLMVITLCTFLCTVVPLLLGMVCKLYDCHAKLNRGLLYIPSFPHLR